MHFKRLSLILTIIVVKLLINSLLTLAQIPNHHEIIHFVQLPFDSYNLTKLSSLVHLDETNRSYILSLGPRKNHVFLRFRVLGKTFVVKAVKGNLPAIVAQDAFMFTKSKAKNLTKLLKTAFSHNFQGYLVNRFGCQVRGYWTSTTLQASISCPLEGETYYLEPRLESRVRNSSALTCVFYKQTDVLREICQANQSVNNSKCLTDSVVGVPGLKITRQKARKNRQAISQDPVWFRRRSCLLHLVSDHTFYQRHFRQLSAVISKMTNVVGGIDSVFRLIDFNGDGIRDEIGFKIKKTTVFDEPHLLPKKNYTGQEVLERLSVWAANQSDYCLTLLFVSRDFSNGIVSMAYEADPHLLGASGGICQKTTAKTRTNVAFVTNLKNGHVLPEAALIITACHALGHSFGSQHDRGSCLSTFPTYIMHPSELEALNEKNRVFSSCSLVNMIAVLRYKGRCLVPDKGPVCGNGIIEDGEDCDCGNEEDCTFLDACCVPATNSQEKKGCVLNRANNYECSPQVSPCCDQYCQIERRSGIVCRGSHKCYSYATCDGKSATCPYVKSSNYNGVPCAGTARLCLNGSCAVTVCGYHKLQDCQCKYPDEELCAVCCKDNISGACLPAYTWGFYVQGQKHTLLPGASCDKNRGYCDTHGTCRKGQSSLSEDNIKGPREWVATDEERWAINFWYYLLFLIIFILFVSIGGFALLERARKMTSDEKSFKMGNAKIKGNSDMEDSYGTLLSQSYRLSSLFPSVPMNEILQVCRSSIGEREMVEVLLGRGYAMRTNPNSDVNSLQVKKMPAKQHT